MVKYVLWGLGALFVILGIMWWRNRQGAAALGSVGQVSATPPGAPPAIPPTAGSVNWHGPAVEARSGRGAF